MPGIQIDRTDGLSSSTAIKGPCRVATTGNIALYGHQMIDGVAIVDGDRVLVKDQTAGYECGIYVCDTGQWRRAKDFNRTTDVRKGTQILVNEGTAFNRTGWMVSSDDPIVIGTDSVEFLQNMLIDVSQFEAYVAAAAASAAAADASASAAAASAAAAESAVARNNFSNDPFTGTGSQTDFPLSYDPGSAANVLVFISGPEQLLSSYSLVYVSAVPTIRFSTAPPNGVSGEFRYGNAVAVGTPADGTITAAKMGAGVVIGSLLTGFSATNVAAVATDTILVAMGKLQGQINSTLSRVLSGFTVGTNTAVTAADTILSGFGKLQAQITALTTTAVSEGINLYFTTSRVLATALTGLSTATIADVVSTDSILTALGKLQGRIAKQRVVLVLGTRGTTVADAVTVYMGDTVNSSEGNAFVVCPIAGTVLGIVCACASVSAGTRTYTLRKALADTIITCSSTGTGTIASDFAHSVTVAVGDILDIKLVTSGGTTVVAHNVSLVIQPS